MDAALRLPTTPPSPTTTTTTTTTTTLDPQLLAAAGLAGRERVVLLPAFLHFLLRLQASSYPLDRVALQFRTFGDDLPRVTREYNALCGGVHPLFPGQAFGDGGGGKGRDFSLDLEGDPECFGCMFRDADGPLMVLGTWESPASREEVARLRARGYRVLDSVEVGDQEARTGWEMGDGRDGDLYIFILLLLRID